MASSENVGQTQALGLKFLDAAGNDVTAQVTPDSAPQWSDTTPATDTLTAAANGLTATALGLAAGDDTINVSVSFAGATFSGTYALTVVQPAPPPPQVASVQIVAVGPPTP